MHFRRLISLAIATLLIAGRSPAAATERPSIPEFTAFSVSQTIGSDAFQFEQTVKPSVLALHTALLLLSTVAARTQ